MGEPVFNFDAKSEPKCALCGKTRWDHQAKTFACPRGMKTRIGYTSFHSEQRFTPKEKK